MKDDHCKNIINTYKRSKIHGDKRIPESIKHEFIVFKSQKKYQENYPSILKNTRGFLKNNSLIFLIVGALVSLGLITGTIAVLGPITIMGTFLYTRKNKKAKTEVYKKEIEEEIKNKIEDVKESEKKIEEKIKSIEELEKLIQSKKDEINFMNSLGKSQGKKVRQLENQISNSEDELNILNPFFYQLIKEHIGYLKKENQIKQEIKIWQEEKKIEPQIQLNDFSELLELVNKAKRQEGSFKRSESTINLTFNKNNKFLKRSKSLGRTPSKNSQKIFSIETQVTRL
jgi:hypothetical protein